MKPGKTLYLITVIILGVFLFSSLHYWKLTIDDAYISARYARHAAAGSGLTFNPGERIMGYTNLLLVLFESVIYRLGGDGILWAKILGLVSGLMVLWLTMRLGLVIVRQNSPVPGSLAALFLIAHPYLAANAVNGLETSLFTSLILLATLTFTQNWLEDRWFWKSHLILASGLFLATLARPEGLGYALILLFTQGIYRLGLFIKDRKSGNRSFFPWNQLAWFLVYSILLIPVLLWLTWYYGSPIPNTFFAKTAAGFTFEKYQEGGLYIIQWFNRIGGIFLLIPAILYPVLSSKKLKAYGLLLLLFMFNALYIVYTGGDWITGFRFIIPVLPYFFLMIGLGLSQLWITLLPRLEFMSPVSRRLLAIILLTIILSPGLGQNITISRAIHARAQGEVEGHQYLGEWLYENTSQDSSIALMDIGLIGYLSERYLIDITGLVNRDIAQMMHQDSGLISSSEPTARQIAEYVLSLQPDYIILNHQNEPGAVPFIGRTHDVAIWTSEDFSANYQYLFSRPYVNEYLSVYQRIEP